jgi:hypothetical protein
MRSLRPELAARAILLPNAPSDFVTINLTYLTDGDRLIPFAGMYRDARFLTRLSRRNCSRLATSSAKKTKLSEADQMRWRTRACPRAYRPLSLMPNNGRCWRALLGTYLDRAPAGLSPLRRYDDESALDAVHVAWAGSTAPGEPHYYRLQGPRVLIEWDNTAAQRQPCSLGVARSHVGLRSRPTRPPPRSTPHLIARLCLTHDQLA